MLLLHQFLPFFFQCTTEERHSRPTIPVVSIEGITLFAVQVCMKLVIGL